MGETHVPEEWITSVATCYGCGAGAGKGTVTLVKPAGTPAPAPAPSASASASGAPGGYETPVKAGHESEGGNPAAYPAPAPSASASASASVSAGSSSYAPANGGSEEGSEEQNGDHDQPSATKKVYVTVVPVPVKEAVSKAAQYTPAAGQGYAMSSGAAARPTGYVPVHGGKPLATPPPPVMYEGGAVARMGGSVVGVVLGVVGAVVVGVL